MKNFWNKLRHDRGDAVLVTVLLSIPLLAVTFAFATGVSMAVWQKTSYISAAQISATDSLQKVQTNGYLGEPSLRSFVSEYLTQTGRKSPTTAGASSGATETAGFAAECTTAEIDGVTRQLPYIEMQLDIARGTGESGISTYDYTSEGTSGVLKAPAGGHGKAVYGQQYRVINATVYEASSNLTWSGLGERLKPEGADMGCQVYTINVSAILFGSNEDLSAGQQCFQPDYFPANPKVAREVGVSTTKLRKSPLSTCTVVKDNLKKYSVVTVLGSYREWSFVELPDGQEGWLRTSDLQNTSTWGITYYDELCKGDGTCGALAPATPTTPANPTSYNWKNSFTAITLVNPSKDKYNYSGWQQINCTSKAPIGEVAMNMKIPFGVDGNLCYKASFATWQNTVTFEDGFGGKLSENKYDFGETIVFPPNQSRAGYTFLGWVDSTGAYVTPGITASGSDTSKIVYKAAWKNNTYDISSIRNNSIQGYAGNSTDTATIKYTYSPNSQNVNVGAGYVCKPGFNTIKYTTNVGTISGSTLTIPAGNMGSITVTASCTAETFSINVSSNQSGASNVGNLYTYSANDTVSGSKTITLTKPSKNYYSWNGWSDLQPSGLSLNGDVLTIPQGFTGNISIKGNLKGNVYNVYFNCNGRGYCHGATTYTYGQGLSISDVWGPNETFDGWTVNYNNRNDMRKNVSISATDNGDKTFYAHWTWTENTTTTHHGSSTVYFGSDGNGRPQIKATVDCPAGTSNFSLRGKTDVSGWSSTGAQNSWLRLSKYSGYFQPGRNTAEISFSCGGSYQSYQVKSPGYGNGSNQSISAGAVGFSYTTGSSVTKNI